MGELLPLPMIGPDEGKPVSRRMVRFEVALRNGLARLGKAVGAGREGLLVAADLGEADEPSPLLSEWEAALTPLAGFAR